MPITKSWEQSLSLKLAEAPASHSVNAPRRREFFWLLGATLMVACGLALVGIAKTQELPGATARLNRGELIDINTATGPDEFLPFLSAISNPDNRRTAAEKILAYRRTHAPFENDGALARLRLGVPIARWKPLMIVRTAREFYLQYALWCAIYFASFWAVHLLWRWRGFRGDAIILPALHLLTGIGLVLAVSLRDPLRDTLEFRKFAWGCSLGCALLLLPLLRLFHYTNFARWTYTPLLAAFALFVLLMVRGSGPTGSDARGTWDRCSPSRSSKFFWSCSSPDIFRANGSGCASFASGKFRSFPSRGPLMFCPCSRGSVARYCCSFY